MGDAVIRSRARDPPGGRGIACGNCLSWIPVCVDKASRSSVSATRPDQKREARAKDQREGQELREGLSMALRNLDSAWMELRSTPEARRGHKFRGKQSASHTELRPARAASEFIRALEGRYERPRNASESFRRRVESPGPVATETRDERVSISHIPALGRWGARSPGRGSTKRDTRKAKSGRSSRSIPWAQVPPRTWPRLQQTEF